MAVVPLRRWTTYRKVWQADCSAAAGRSSKPWRPRPVTKDERADDRQIDGVGANAGGESRRIGAEMIVKHTRQPSPNRHAAAAAQEKGRNAPKSLRGRIKLSDRQHIGGDNTGKAQAEGGGDGE